MIIREPAFGEILTPGTILGHANVVDSDVLRVSTAIMGSSVDDGFKSGWMSFAEAWGQFYDSLQGVTGWAQRLWAGTDDQIDDYQTRLVSWEQSFRAAGGQVPGGPVAPPSPAFSLEGILGQAKWIVIGGAALYALVTFGPALSRAFSSSRRK
jgi:hypothetical protein